MGDPEFRMTIEDVFFIRGRGTVVTGVISQGTLNLGDIVTVIRDDVDKQVRVSQIEVSVRRRNSASSGDRVGIFLDDISKDEVSRGDILEGTALNYDDIW